MITRIKKINPENPEKSIIEEAAAIIKEGGLVAFPTETVYGLGADALLAEGAKRIYAAKGRPSDNPLIVHIADFSSLDLITDEIPDAARALADAFWPGPLTMIFKKSDAVPLATTGGLDTVAVRMPSHPAALALISESGGYIAAPSANTSGRPSPTLAAHVAFDLDGKIPMILDGGPVGIGIESTIVDLTGDVPQILRPGYITRDMVEDVIGRTEDDPGLTSDDPDVHPKAPGMKYRHYAPKADLVLVDGDIDKVTAAINRLAAENREKGVVTGVICTAETEGLYQADIVRSTGSREDEVSISRHLYALLREFDALGAGQIYSECFSDLDIGTAVMNRLTRAAGHKIIHV